jgi:signal transduction histidine kinase
MSTDISATKLLEKEKLEAERLAAVGQTVAGLAHGIKNVLMGLEGGMYVVRSGMEKGDGDRIFQGWQMLEENITRITAFVKGFLEFARGTTPEVNLVDPNRIARKVVELFRHTAKLEGIELKGNLQPDIPYALLDEEGIHTCLSNLVSNALDACQISDKNGRHVTLSTHDQDGKLVYEVADDGNGIDYEIKKKIFTNFFSTKGSDKGTGLGLLATRKIVQEHGGKVSFDSKKGMGSVFRLEFPRDRLPQPTNTKQDEP